MIRRIAYWSAVALRRSARFLERLDSNQTWPIQRAMTAHDMVAHRDEGYYQEQYWRWLLPELEHNFPDRQAHALDIGCGQGRLALPLAAWLAQGCVVGVDVTPSAVAQARRYAEQHRLMNMEFHEADALEFIRTQPPASFDIALMLEVAFFMPTYRMVIAAAARVLKPGGLFGISFRSQYFDLLHSVHLRDWASAQMVRDSREGHWGGGSMWFSWHTATDIRQLLAENGFAVSRLYGIGIASGIEGDPMSCIAQPSKLSPVGQSQLIDLEMSLAEQYADCGRYILAIARRVAVSETEKQEKDL